VASLTWDRVRAWRVARSHLDRRVPKRRMLDVVSDVCGMHAQVPSAAELQVWARVDGVRPKDVQDALWERRTLVRSWMMRGTLHLVPASEYPAYVAALGTNDRWWKGAWLRMVGMTAPQLRETLDAVAASVDGSPITRAQLTERVVRRKGTKAGERMGSNWGEMLKPVAFAGGLCSGPPRGQNVTFVRPDRWLREWREWEPEEGWRHVVRRYLAAYGPATREDFARWWGMQPAPAGRVLSSMPEGDLAEVGIEGTTGWMLASDVASLDTVPSVKGSVRLLPGFDPYTVGFRPREEFVEPRFAPLVSRQAGWISPVVLVDGRAVGVWSFERAARGIEVTVQLFGKLAAARRKAVAEEADRLGAFLGTPTAVSFTEGPPPTDARRRSPTRR
jgi:hypothetical protein